MADMKRAGWKVSKDMDTVFDQCTDDELSFDILFDDDDTIIDHMAGVDEAGVPITGPDFDWDALMEAGIEDADVSTSNPSIPEDEKYNAEKNGDQAATEKQANGVKKDPLEVGGEVGDGKEVSGKQNSAEAQAHDDKEESEAIGANDKQQTQLEDASEGPLEDDDPAERAGEVSDTAVNTESVDETALAESIIAKIKQKKEEKAADKEAEKDEKSDKKDDKSEAQNEGCEGGDCGATESEDECGAACAAGSDDSGEKVEESAQDKLGAKIQAALEAKLAAQKEADELIMNEVLESMTVEELQAENAQELVQQKINAVKEALVDKTAVKNMIKTSKVGKKEVGEVCKACGHNPCTCKSTNEATDPIADTCDNAEREGKVDKDTKNVEGVKTDVMGDSITGNGAMDDPIIDIQDDEARDGKTTKDDNKVEGVGTKTVGAALEGAEDPLTNVEDSDARDGEVAKDQKDNIEGVGNDTVGAALESDSNIDDLLADAGNEDEDIEAIANGDLVIPDEVREDDDSNDLGSNSKNESADWFSNLTEAVSDSKVAEETKEDIDDADIEMIKNDEIEAEDPDLDYSYDDDELIDLVVSGDIDDEE